jgi:hypothetical protein
LEAHAQQLGLLILLLLAPGLSALLTPLLAGLLPALLLLTGLLPLLLATLLSALTALLVLLATLILVALVLLCHFTFPSTLVGLNYQPRAGILRSAPPH